MITQHQQPVSIILADDHSLFREGLKRILNMEQDMEVIAECGNGIEVIEQCNQTKPDIVLMDINMPVENGVVATQRMRNMFPDVKVIILSIHDDESYVFETLRLGASGYLLKDMEANDLVNAIRSVMQGYSYIHPKVTGKLISQMRRMAYLNEVGVAGSSTGISMNVDGGVQFIAEDTPLTKRETDVLRLMSEGKSNKAISDSLVISEKTVKNHVSSILQKMDVDDRTQAVLTAIKLGWVTI